jgi:hypothetical protein
MVDSPGQKLKRSARHRPVMLAPPDTAAVSVAQYLESYAGARLLPPISRHVHMYGCLMTVEGRVDLG